MITFRICCPCFSVSCIKLGAALLVVFGSPAFRLQVCKAEEESIEDDKRTGAESLCECPRRSNNKSLFKGNPHKRIAGFKSIYFRHASKK